MKKRTLFFLLVFTAINVAGQQSDNFWPLSGGPGFMYYNLDFSSGNADTVTIQRRMPYFFTNGSISDSIGNFLFSTNGQWISNKNHDTLLNSQNFNPGYYTNYYTYGLGFAQAALILSFSDTSFYIFHNSADTFLVNGIPDAQPFNLKYTLVNKFLDNGNGGVVLGMKGIAVINDTLLLGRITACKHANGRDWWIMVHKYYSDVYYSLLATPNGIYGPYIQQIGTILYPKLFLGIDFDFLGMSVFSPDGSKYVNIDYDTLQLFNFDRCTGLLSNFQSIPILQSDSLRLIGCSFSSNSKYLYANTRLKAFQINTDTSNVASSVTLIATYDGFTNPSQTWFCLSQIGLDGKIYLSTYNGTNSLHVIEKPDSSGVTSNFSQHSFTLPPLNGNTTLPNFPNYRLGRLIGSPCDTLTSTIETHPLDIKLKINPNPNNGIFIINYDLPQNKSGTLEILDVVGKSVFKQTLPQWSVMQRLNLEKLRAGIYVLKLMSDNKSSVVKFVKH